MHIPSKYLDQLRDAGLLVSEPFVPYHVAYPDGHCIGKPQVAGGNALAGYQAYWGAQNILVDAPTVYFHADRGHWFVSVAEYIPGSGPGDFVHTHQTPEEAVADILDYFFGNPTRMQE